MSGSIHKAHFFASLGSQNYEGKPLKISKKTSQLVLTRSFAKGKNLQKISETTNNVLKTLPEISLNQNINYYVLKANIEDLNRKIKKHNDKYKELKNANWIVKLIKGAFFHNVQISIIVLSDRDQFEQQLTQAFYSSGADLYSPSDDEFGELYECLPERYKKRSDVKIIEVGENQSYVQIQELLKADLTPGQLRMCIFLSKNEIDETAKNPLYVVFEDEKGEIIELHGDILYGYAKLWTQDTQILQEDDDEDICAKLNKHFGFEEEKAVKLENFQLSSSSIVRFNRIAPYYEASNNQFKMLFQALPDYIKTDPRVIILETTQDMLGQEKTLLERYIHAMCDFDGHGLRFYVCLSEDKEMILPIYVVCRPEGEPTFYFMGYFNDDNQLSLNRYSSPFNTLDELEKKFAEEEKLNLEFDNFALAEVIEHPDALQMDPTFQKYFKGNFVFYKQYTRSSSRDPKEISLIYESSSENYIICLHHVSVSFKYTEDGLHVKGFKQLFENLDEAILAIQKRFPDQDFYKLEHPKELEPYFKGNFASVQNFIGSDQNSPDDSFQIIYLTTSSEYRIVSPFSEPLQLKCEATGFYVDGFVRPFRSVDDAIKTLRQLYNN